MGFDAPVGIFGQIGPAGTVWATGLAVLAFGLFLLAARPNWRRGPGASSVREIVPESLVAFFVAAAVFPPAITLIQAPLQAILSRWTMANLATANQAVLMLPAVLVSGLVQEPVKLLAALLGGATARLGEAKPGPPARAILVGVVAGAGFGWLEAAVVLSATLAATGHLSTTAGLGAIAPAVVERFSAIIFHLASTGIVVRAWTRGSGCGLVALGVMMLVHGFFNYFASLILLILRPGLVGIVITEGFIALVSVGLLLYLVRLLKADARQTSAPGA